MTDTTDTAETPAPTSDLEELNRAKLAVMAEIDDLPLDGENTAQHYRYTRGDTVLRCARRALLDAELVVATSALEPTLTEVTTARGAEGTHVVIGMEVTLTHVPSGQSETTVHYGEAVDFQDKAVGQAMTNARKQWVFNTFLSTSEPPDGASRGPTGRTARRRSDRGRGGSPDSTPSGGAPSRPAATAFRPADVPDLGKDLIAQTQMTVGELRKAWANRGRDMPRLVADMAGHVYKSAAGEARETGAAKVALNLSHSGDGAVFVRPDGTVYCSCGDGEGADCAHARALAAHAPATDTTNGEDD